MSGTKKILDADLRQRLLAWIEAYDRARRTTFAHHRSEFERQDEALRKIARALKREETRKADEEEPTS